MTTLFIEADEPLLVFSSVEDAEQHIEAADVRDGIYTRAFGRAGEPYSITTEGECVVVRPIEKPADPESLRELLRRSLQGVGETVPHDADLPTLLPLPKRSGQSVNVLSAPQQDGVVWS